MRRLFVLTLLLLAAPMAAAQGHEHGAADGVALVLHDGEPDGRVVAGAVTTFGFALLKDGAPVVHRDAQFEVMHNGAPLFQTTDTHEYDGLFTFQVIFPSAGPYQVRATSEGMQETVFEGIVVESPGTFPARLVLDATPMQGTNGFEAVISIVDENGDVLPHTDALVEVRAASDQRLISRFHTHIHRTPMRFWQVSETATELELHVTAYRASPRVDRPDFAPFTGVFHVKVDALPTDPQLAIPPGAPSPLSPQGPQSSADGYTLHGMMDPQNLAALGSPFRVAALLTGPDLHAVQHVDYRLQISGPGGVLFASETLHEYDGFLEHVYTPQTPGWHVAEVTANHGETEIGLRQYFLVSPGVLPLSPGAHRIHLDVPDRVHVGEAAPFTFTIASDAGPLAHSEVDVAIGRPGEVAIYRFKLHTHASGMTQAALMLPSEGAWEVRVDPVLTMPQASLVERAVFTVVALPGTLPIDPASLDVTPLERAVPMPGAMSLVPMALLALLVRREREPRPRNVR